MAKRPKLTLKIEDIRQHELAMVTGLVHCQAESAADGEDIKKAVG